ncbi:MAG: hypothetical protein ACLFRI_01900 [Candidatus Izemoplasmataceae bacterium]
MALKRLIFLAMCITILFVQEQLLILIPNVQFTTLLVVLYAALFTFKENVLIIMVYVFLDNLALGTLYPLMMAPMFIAWMIIPISYHTFLRKTKNVYILAFFGILFGILYGFVFVPFRMIEQEVFDIWAYIIADIPFQIVMALSNFITILWLFTPLYNTLNKELIKWNQLEH